MRHYLFEFLRDLYWGIKIVPLFWIDSTIEEVDGMRPTPLELAGRDIYLREGCSRAIVK